MLLKNTYFRASAAAVLTSALLALTSVAASAKPTQDFSSFIASLWPQAKAAGVSRKTFDTAFAGVKPDYSIPDLDIPGRPKIDNAGQAEFTKTAADYLSKPYLEKLGVQGKKFLAEHRAALERIEKLTGVDRYTLCLLYTSPSPRDGLLSRMPSSA